MKTKSVREPLFLDGEEWRSINGWPQFQVSNLGRIKSLARVVRRFDPHWGVDSNCFLKEKIIKTSDFYGVDRRGVKRPFVAAKLVCFQADGKKKYYYVHVLVLDAFVGPRPKGMEACHNDGDGTNNKLSNLRWDTHKANIQDSISHGTFYPRRMKGNYTKQRSKCH